MHMRGTQEAYAENEQKSLLVSFLSFSTIHMCKHAFAGRNTQQWQDLCNCSSKNFCSKDFLSNRSLKGKISKV